jgi:hypothetical protein
VTAKAAPGWVLGQIYEIAGTQDLPPEAQGEDTGIGYRPGARHRLQEPEIEVNRASDEDIVALLHACRSARDRLIVLLMARVGLRVGQLAGLRRCDAHLMVDSRILGCDVEGPHLHVVRRQNPNAAWSRSRSSVWFPVDFLVVQAFDQYVYERHELLGNDSSDFLLVNLFPPPAAGSPVTPDAVGELLRTAPPEGKGGPAPHPAHCSDGRSAATSPMPVARSTKYSGCSARRTLARPSPTCAPMFGDCGPRSAGLPARASKARRPGEPGHRADPAPRRNNVSRSLGDGCGRRGLPDEQLLGSRRQDHRLSPAASSTRLAALPSSRMR